MSFPRAAIRRFNETADTSIPAPGAYDPKFATDVSVSSTLKGIVFEKWHRNNGNKARPEDNELSSSSGPSAGRLSRAPSFTRRSSITTVNNDGRREPSKNQTPTHKTRVKGSSSSQTNTISRKAPSITKCNKLLPNQDEVANPVVVTSAANNPLDPNSLAQTMNEDVMVCQEVITSIQEIQNMAEALQVEVSEYKRRLTNELIRNQELEAKKLELEFTINSLRRELGKYDSAKAAWEFGEQSHHQQIDQLNTAITKLEKEICDLQTHCDNYKDSEFQFRNRISHLEKEKTVFNVEREGYEKALKDLRNTVAAQEGKISEADGKCKELLAQMDSCYHMCESRMADAENMKEILEVRVQELNQEKDDLEKELDNMRRALETEKTLTELIKSEEEGDQQQNNKHENNYIS